MASSSSSSSSFVSSNSANAVLREVMDQHVQIDEGERTRMVKIIEGFVKKDLVKNMKEVDTTFRKYFREIYHTGSFYDGLRVNNAYEFDLDFVFHLNEKDTCLFLEEDKVRKGYVRVWANLDDDSDDSDGDEDEKGGVPKIFLEDPEADETYVIAEKMRNWMEGVVAKALNKMSTKDFYQYAIKKVTTKKHGPARLLEIRTSEHEILEVDLVPAFIFPEKALSDHPRIYQEIINMKKWSFNKSETTFRKTCAPHGDWRKKNKWLERSFLIVPKGFSWDEEDAALLWSLSFAEQERKALKGPGKECVKPVIRLLKTFRDHNQVMSGITSYALKTVVMQMMKSFSGNFEPWKKQENLSDLFLKALGRLHEYLGKGEIPHIFDEESNLLKKMEPEAIESMRTWLGRAVKELRSSKDGKQCRTVWSKYFIPM